MEKINVLVTGANGFIGRNLIATLENIQSGKSKADFAVGEIYKCDVDTLPEQLCEFTNHCDFVFHLAGVNRPDNNAEFMIGNYGFTTELLVYLIKNKNKSPILMSSSIQSSQDNDYGKSKRAGEDYLTAYGTDNGISTYIFHLPNVFGKWSRPNYNSAVATFCNNIAKGLPVSISDRNYELTLVYIDDVIHDFLSCVSEYYSNKQTSTSHVNYEVASSNSHCDNIKCSNGADCDNGTNSTAEYCNDSNKGNICRKINCEHRATLGYIVDTLYKFKESRVNLNAVKMENNSLEKKLYSTYISYYDTQDFAYDLKMNVDSRGSFTEFIKFAGYGQVSVNVSGKGITKGNHWHHSKNEKFLVVSGQGVIRLRLIGDAYITEYYVSGEKMQVIDIPCGYTHNIENMGDCDMVTVMWANEAFAPDKPDTFYENV